MLPPEWVVFLMAMLPIVELRGAIPWALHPSGGAMGWKEAYLLAVAGNMVPVVPLLALLGPISDFLSRYRYTRWFFEWLFARTRRRGKVVEKYRALGLCLFVAIPLPVTGAWTGTAAALVFGVPFRYAGRRPGYIGFAGCDKLVVRLMRRPSCRTGRVKRRSGRSAAW
jgi:uncharacterized membrane protein